MAVSPKFEYDIFISYARDDNRDIRWVDRFHEALENELKYRWGYKELKIWRDRDLDGAMNFDLTIQNRIRESALFFVLNSRNYEQSDYCKKELNWFHQYNDDRPNGLLIGERSRIFHILLNNIPYDQWPEMLQGSAGFPMHDQPEKSENLGDFIPYEDVNFAAQLRKIVDTVEETLKKLIEKQVEHEKESSAFQKKTLLTTRIFSFVLFIFLITTGIAIWEAFNQKKAVEHQTQLAEQRQKIAEEERKKAKHQAKIAEHQKEVAENERKEAKRQADIAKQQRKIAIEESQRKEKQTTIANQEREKAKYQTLIANYSLAKLFEKKAHDYLQIAKKQRDIGALEEAFLYGAVAFKQLVPIDKQSLAQNSIGSLFQSGVIKTAFSGRWHSSSRWHSFLFMSDTTSTPDKNTIVFLSKNKRIHLYSKKELSSSILSSLYWKTSSEVFSPYEDMVATFAFDQTIYLRSRNNKIIALLKGHSDYVTGVAFSLNGDTIASSSQDKTIRLWSKKGEHLVTLKSDSLPLWNAIFSPDGHIIASIFDDNTIRLWSKKGKFLTTLKGHSDLIRHVAFNPEGNTIISSSEDKTIRLWSKKGESIATLRGHLRAVNSVAFSPDGHTIASVSDDHTIRLWSKKGQHIATWSNVSSSVEGITFTPDGNTIISASKDLDINFWDFTPFQLFVTKDAKATPLFHALIDGLMFFWNVELDGLEFKKRTPDPIRDKKFLPLLNPPKDGQSKYDQILEWAKKQTPFIFPLTVDQKRKDFQLKNIKK